MDRVYIDTSVVGGCLDKEFEVDSNAFFIQAKRGKFILLLSDILRLEMEGAPKKVKEKFIEIQNYQYEAISLTLEAIALADRYIAENAVALKSLSDARHIALATINRADVLVSWNFKHIVNYKRIHLFNAVNKKYGYPEIEIRSPKEVIYE